MKIVVNKRWRLLWQQCTRVEFPPIVLEVNSDPEADEGFVFNLVLTESTREKHSPFFKIGEAQVGLRLTPSDLVDLAVRLGTFALSELRRAAKPELARVPENLSSDSPK